MRVAMRSAGLAPSRLRRWAPGVRVLAVWAGGVTGALLATPALAGPPYLTDDPEPTDTGHWEIYNFATGSAEPGTIAAQFGEDLNYGAAPDVQLTATLPLQVATGLPVTADNVQLAGKYRFARQDGALGLDIAAFPRVFLPTAPGARHAQVLLPLWAQRDAGPWSVFFGGGWTLHPGTGQRNFWQGGAAVTRTVRPGWSLGVEYFAQGRDADDGRPLRAVQIGTQVHIHGPFSWLATLGQGLNARETTFYTALKLDL